MPAGGRLAARNRRLLHLALGITVAACLSSCSSGGASAESVYEKCNQDDKLELTSDKKAIEFDYDYQEEPDDTIFDCLLKETGAPSSVEYRVGKGKKSDPLQSESWDGWEILWSNSGSFPDLNIHLGQK